MFRLLHPYPDGRGFNRVVGGSDLQPALATLVREHWLPELTAATGVWHNDALVAHALLGWNRDTGQPVPYLKEIDPPRQHSLACGD